LTVRSESVFDVGQMAVYPAHGVGVIESIEHRKVGESEQSFYVMKILKNNMVIMIPTATSTNVGLRSIISSKEVNEVFDILQEKDVEIGTQTWNRRYREYMEKIKTGSVFEVAEVLRDLYLLQEDKDLSYGERKMMDTAKSLLVKELSIANKTEEYKVEEKIEQIFT
jgi:CarD family transcriptional regulator, regulator of rRNA transcription